MRDTKTLRRKGLGRDLLLSQLMKFYCCSQEEAKAMCPLLPKRMPKKNKTVIALALSRRN